MMFFTTQVEHKEPSEKQIKDSYNYLRVLFQTTITHKVVDILGFRIGIATSEFLNSIGFSTNNPGIHMMFNYSVIDISNIDKFRAAINHVCQETKGELFISRRINGV
jgi:hypothetical protein